MDSLTTSPPVTARKRNWWKVAFFVLLIVFELTREIAVLASARGADPNADVLVFGGGEDGYRYASASGEWKRSDNGDKLVKNTVSIECREHIGQCVTAHVHISDEYVYAPEISFHEAVFGPDGVTIVNDDPTCARYVTRIDTKLKQAFQVRERKTAAGECGKIEERIQMTMGGGFDRTEFEAERDAHFLPLMALLSTIL